MLEYHRCLITNAKSRVSFSTDDDPRPWFRYLTVDNQPLYRLGTLCDTCMAVFERLGSAQDSISAAQVSGRLRVGLTNLDQNVVEAVARLLPSGQYVVGLLSAQPRFKVLRQEADLPEVKVWACANSREIAPTLDEFVLPLHDLTDLHESRVAEHITALASGAHPTALALSLVDVRYRNGQHLEWRLIHVLLDGHHKLMAASRLGQPITLLSLLSLDNSIVSPAWIQTTLDARYGQEVQGVWQLTFD